MNRVWVLVYNFFVLPLLFLFIKVASLFNEKIRQGIRDREKIFEELIINFADINRRKKMIWFHSSSLGEFEQAKPLIEKIKNNNCNILVTFFSPSGYRNSVRYPYKDVISYLPFDTAKNMRRFIQIVRPDTVVFMRYDIWPNMVWELNKKNIPMFIVDATMRNNSRRKWFLVQNFHKTIYNCFTKILTVSENDKQNFCDFIEIKEMVKSVGDTRFDRVYQKSLDAKNKKLFKDNFFDNKKVIVAGSTWEADEEILLPTFIKLIKYYKECVFIVVPHEPTIMNLEKLEHSLFGKAKSIRFSSLNNYSGEQIIIIDSIGILLSLYYYADIAYVGGSFRQGIHNVLEPAVYGIPVLYGPKIKNSQEAIKLADNNGGIVITDLKSSYRSFKSLLTNDNFRLELGKKSKDYVIGNIGATEKILKEIMAG